MHALPLSHTPVRQLRKVARRNAKHIEHRGELSQRGAAKRLAHAALQRGHATVPKLARPPLPHADPVVAQGRVPLGRGRLRRLRMVLQAAVGQRAGVAPAALPARRVPAVHLARPLRGGVLHGARRASGWAAARDAAARGRAVHGHGPRLSGLFARDPPDARARRVHQAAVCGAPCDARTRAGPAQPLHRAPAAVPLQARLAVGDRLEHCRALSKDGRGDARADHGRQPLAAQRAAYGHVPGPRGVLNKKHSTLQSIPTRVRAWGCARWACPRRRHRPTQRRAQTRGRRRRSW